MSAGTVRDIDDEDLVARTLRSLAHRKVKNPKRGRWLWESVMETFLLGRTYAHQLCARFGHDPELRVRK